MTRKNVTRYAPIAGVVSVAVAYALDLTGLLGYEPWEIALSFPLGAGAYLFIAFLSEKVGA